MARRSTNGALRSAHQRNGGRGASAADFGRRAASRPDHKNLRLPCRKDWLLLAKRALLSWPGRSSRGERLKGKEALPPRYPLVGAARGRLCGPARPLVDSKLGDGEAASLIQALNRRGIPVVIYPPSTSAQASPEQYSPSACGIVAALAIAMKLMPALEQAQFML